MQYTADRRQRLDAFLARVNPTESRMQWGKNIRSGLVLVNGRRVRKPAHMVLPGEKIEHAESTHPLSESHIPSHNLHLSILYEDAACMVIDKPAGTVVHPAPGVKKHEVTLLSGIVELFRERTLPFSASAVLVHRLDRDTTGCLLIAKSFDAHRLLQRQFHDRTVQKTYLALVCGSPEHDRAMIDASIGRSVRNRTKMSVHGMTQPRTAQTSYTVLSRSERASLLACNLHTGRTHQIRVHLSAIGHPILGDATYATDVSLDLAKVHDIKTPCLHAWKLRFVSPEDQKEHQVQSPPPKSFVHALQALEVQWKEERK